jgi:lipid II:glycine glycyltransferase (peptidoglycan interpeptide bridge formation enzyme)
MSLFDHLIKYGENHRWKSFELRGGQSLPLLSKTSSTYSRHILNLSENEDEIFSSFKANTKRNIKRAINNEVRVEVCRTLDSIKEFYRLNCMTRKRHGLPPQPFHFFKKVYEHIISQNLGIVILASHEKTFIAGAVFFHFGENAFFKYGASDKNFHHLRPNNLIMWEVIKWYSQNGYKSICFGRTEPENNGLRRFKSGWGAKERVEKYFKYDIRKNEFVRDSLEIRKIYHQVFRKIPVPLLKIVGSLLYRHVG